MGPFSTSIFRGGWVRFRQALPVSDILDPSGVFEDNNTYVPTGGSFTYDVLPGIDTTETNINWAKDASATIPFAYQGMMLDPTVGLNFASGALEMQDGQMSAQNPFAATDPGLDVASALDSPIDNGLDAIAEPDTTNDLGLALLPDLPNPLPPIHPELTAEIWANAEDPNEFVKAVVQGGLAGIFFGMPRAAEPTPPDKVKEALDLIRNGPEAAKKLLKDAEKAAGGELQILADPKGVRVAAVAPDGKQILVNPDAKALGGDVSKIAAVILFELGNVINFKAVNDLRDKARQGLINRIDFVVALELIEFPNVQRVHDITKNGALGKDADIYNGLFINKNGKEVAFTFNENLRRDSASNHYEDYVQEWNSFYKDMYEQNTDSQDDPDLPVELDTKVYLTKETIEKIQKAIGKISQ